MKIHLLTFEGCPNADKARESLRRCLEAEGLDPEFEEVDVLDDSTAPEHRGWGSPTILVNGVDVAGAERSGAESCRLYGDNRGVPPDHVIRQAIRAGSSDD